MSWQDELRSQIAALALTLERTTSELAVGLGEFHNGLRLKGARSVQVGAGGRTLAYAGSGRLVGWSLQAQGGLAEVRLLDGRDASGDLLAVLTLADDTAALPTSHAQWLGPGGVSFTEGLYVEVDPDSDGALVGSVWLGAVD